MCTIAESDGAGAEHSGICVLACAVLQLCHRWRFSDHSALTGGVGSGAEATLITPPSYLTFFLPFELVELLDGNSVKFARIFCAQVRASTAWFARTRLLESHTEHRLTHHFLSSSRRARHCTPISYGVPRSART